MCLNGHKCGGCSDTFFCYAGLLGHYDEHRDDEHGSYLARHKNLGKDVLAFQARKRGTSGKRMTRMGGHDDTVYVFVTASWAERARELSHSARNPDDVAKEIFAT